MPTCKNCGGSNKKVVLNYTPKSYTICPDPGTCPESYLCSEILDTACIQYTAGDILYCGTNFSVVDNSESLENALQNILDLVCRNCALKVDIISNPEEESLPSLTTEITNGQAPYTYQWEIAQGEFVGHLISGSATTSSLNLTCIGANSIITGDIDKNIKVSNIKLTVLDAKGCKEVVHFVYASDCYSMLVDEPQPRQAFLGGRIDKSNGLKTKFAYTPMDYLDNPLYMPTCTDIKNMCCVECFESEEQAATNYRQNRDEHLKWLNENLLDEGAGSAMPEKALNYTQWEQGGLADQLKLYKGSLVNYNFLSGCPECTFKLWTETSWPQLDNQTLAERFSMLDPEDCTKFVFIDAVSFGNTPPTGQPGQLLLWQNDPGSPQSWAYYAWDPVTNSWSSSLGEIFEEINNDNRGKRDAWLKAFNEVLLAQMPFVWTNEYALLHRYKYELKITV